MHLSPNQLAWRRFRRHRPAMCSAVFLLGLLFIVVVIPVLPKAAPPSAARSTGWLAPVRYDPNRITDAQFQKPGREHWLGTDVHGRDLLARLLAGARISLLVGLVGAGVALVIGVAWGAIAGYLGGRWDELMMRVVDILYSLPSIIFVIVLITTLESLAKSWFENRFGTAGPMLVRATPMLFLFAGLGAVSWLTMARIVRGQVLSLRTRSFIDASRVLGASQLRILTRHILPNIYGIIIVYLTLTVPAIILYESFLSYLGLGIQPPLASWGSLIAEGAEQLNPFRTYWWLIVYPAVGLVSTLVALSFVGDGLRDAWDPKAS